MKVKFLLVYVIAGALFVGASLWVFLSNGKSAKALRYKYKLGGIMLTAWSFITAASCTGGVPEVMCYEPVSPEVMCYDPVRPMDMMSVTVKGYEGNRLKSGDIMVVTIASPSSNKYICTVNSVSDNSLLQKEELTAPEIQNGELVFEIKLAPTDYKGEATVSLTAVDSYPDGRQEERQVSGSAVIVII